MSSEHHNSPVDEEVISSLLELGGPELLSELVDLFCSDAHPQMATLDEAVQADDAARVAEVAHSLKSSCANLGAMRLSELAKELETAGRSGSLESAAEVIEVSKIELERVTEALKSHTEE